LLCLLLTVHKLQNATSNKTTEMQKSMTKGKLIIKDLVTDREFI